MKKYTRDEERPRKSNERGKTSRTQSDKPRYKKEGEGREKREFTPRRKEYGDKKEFGPKREFTPRRKEYGDKKEFGPKREFTPRRKEYGDKKEFGPKREFTPKRKEYGDKKEFGPKREFTPRRKEYGDKKEFGPKREFTPRRKEYGDKKEFGPKREFTPKRKEYGDKKEFGPKREFTPRRKEYGDKKEFGPKREFTPRRKEYGDKKEFGPKREFAPRREYGDKRKPASKSKRETSSTKKSDDIRLNKFIANSGISSRREADEYITAGLVSVNGKIVTELGTKIKAGDDVRFNGERMKGERKVYIVMNKPKGYVTTTSDAHDEDTVMDLIGEKCKERVFPVGRLDKNTTGVLLFTNDGELTERLTHPSYNKKKIYHVFLDKNVKQTDLEKMAEGITLEDGPIHADEISYVDNDKTQIGLEIHSGRNRVVRRMFEHLGYTVKKLDRVYFAGLTKKQLARGQWRFLTEQEVSALHNNAYE